MLGSLTHAIDLLNGLISLISILGVRLGKSKYLILDVRNTFVKPHTKHDGWNYSKSSSIALLMLTQLREIG
jgi:hypothetical protein